MSVEFSNAYQEILFDNLVSIIKQNFVFQTQLKLAEDTGKAKEELQVKYNDLMLAFRNAQEELGQIDSYKAKADQNDSAHEEKSRLQSALNDAMKKSSGLQKELDKKDAELVKLKEYVTKLEDIAPLSKLKKINPEKAAEEKSVAPVEPAPQNLFAIKADDGSSF